MIYYLTWYFPKAPKSGEVRDDELVAIGLALTSPVVQMQLVVNQPDFGVFFCQCDSLRYSGYYNQKPNSTLCQSQGGFYFAEV